MFPENILSVLYGNERLIFEALSSLESEIIDKLSLIRVVGRNPHGETSRGFDEEISRIIFQWLRKRGFKGHIITEELISRGNSDEIILLDPIDGSVNLSRGINIYALEIAYGEKLDLDSISAGIVWVIPEKKFFIGLKRRGAYSLSNSQITRLKCERKDYEDTVIDICNTRGEAFEAIKDFATIRMYGSIAYSLTKLIEGAIDGVFDNSGKLKLTDVAGVIPMLEESSAFYKIEVLNEINVNPRCKIVASNDKELFNKLLELLN